MKITYLILATLLSGTSFALAGHEVIDTKSMKETQPVTAEPLFKDHELQFSDYAVYSVGNGPTHAGIFRDHSWGSGSEVNYFFTRYLGLGAEYSSSYGQESPDTDRGDFHHHRGDRDRREFHHDHDRVDIQHAGGNLFFRWPIESLHLAPYAYLGGGADFGDRQWASAHGGVGFEYRIIQHFLPSFVAERVGFFADARWSYLGDRSFPDDHQSRGDLNFFTVRSGFRFTY